MRAVKRLHARNKETACEYTHLQVWVWDACNLHKLIIQLQLIKFVYWDNWIHSYS